MMESPLLITTPVYLAQHHPQHFGPSTPRASHCHDSFFSYNAGSEETHVDEAGDEQQQQQRRPLLELDHFSNQNNNNHNSIINNSNAQQAPCKRPRRHRRTGSQHPQQQNGQQNETAKSAKRVRFAVDENDRPNEEVHTYERPDEEFRCDLFWDKAELANMLRTYKETGAWYATCRSDCVDSIRILFAGDAEASRTDPFGLLSRTTSPEEARAVAILSESRGLERRISVLIKKHRKFCIRNLLDLQEQLKAESFATKQSVLSRRSQLLTVRAAHLAAKLAEGDAKLASLAY